MASLLEYIVQEELEDRGERLKAFTIAMDVFGRGADFDPQSDSIVRVEMFRLRTALAEYYQTDGRDDPVKISIPKGKYRPHFEARSAPMPDHTAPTEKVSWITSAGSRPLRGALAACVAITLFGSGYLMAQPSAADAEVGSISTLQKSGCMKRN